MALDFLAGCAGGVAGVLVGHPFDTVKVSHLSWFLVSVPLGAQSENRSLQGLSG